jgi:hypothetical protein
VPGGQHYAAFFVPALTSTPGIYFDSPVDTGYSLDNLAPSPPPNLRMASATEVAWDECPDGDFDYFAVYGSDAVGLDSTATLIGYTVDTAMNVTDEQYYYYHVTATDFSGNEGDGSSIENSHARVSIEDVLPEVFALSQNRPNPFESGTLIASDLPEACAVRLEIVDAPAYPSHPCPGERIEAPLNPNPSTGLNHFFFSLFSFRFSFGVSLGFFFCSFLLSRFP